MPALWSASLKAVKVVPLPQFHLRLGEVESSLDIGESLRRTAKTFENDYVYQSNLAKKISCQEA